MLSTAKISSIPQQALGPEFPSSPAAGVPPYGFSQVRWDRVRAFPVMAGTARGAGKRAEPVLCGCRFFPPEARTDTLFPVFLGFRSGTGPIFRPAVLLSRIVAVSSYRVSVFKGMSRASGRDAPYPPSKERRNARFRYNRRLMRRTGDSGAGSSHSLAACWDSSRGSGWLPGTGRRPDCGCASIRRLPAWPDSWRSCCSRCSGSRCWGIC